MNTQMLTVLLVIHRSRDVVGETMQVLRKAYEAGMIECIVIDNASHDGTVQFLQREHPWAAVIENTRNVGYGRALNIGLTHANTKYVLFMNPDAIIEPEALGRLLQFMEANPAAGIAAPATLDAQGVLQTAGAPPTPRTILAKAAGLTGKTPGARPIVPGARPFMTDWLCGALLIARKKLVDDLGGFDPRFFLYFEETDLCRRATRAGSELWAVGEAVARHLNAASSNEVADQLFSGCTAKYYFPSRFYYLRKHHGLAAALCVEISELLLLGGRDLKNWLVGRPSRMLAARLRAPILRAPSERDS